MHFATWAALSSLFVLAKAQAPAYGEQMRRSTKVQLLTRAPHKVNVEDKGGRELRLVLAATFARSQMTGTPRSVTLLAATRSLTKSHVLAVPAW
jgi:hypothetical protein